MFNNWLSKREKTDMICSIYPFHSVNTSTTANYKQTMWYHWTQSWEEMCSQLLQIRTSWLPKQKLLGPFDSVTFDSIGESWDQEKKPENYCSMVTFSNHGLWSMRNKIKFS